MKTTVLLTTSLLIYMAEPRHVNLPEGLRWRRSGNDRISQPININQTEFEAKMRVYQRVTRGTSQYRGYDTVIPANVDTATGEGVLYTFSSPHFQNAEGIMLKMLMKHSTRFSVFQTVSGKEVEITSKDLLSGSPQLWVDVHLQITPEIIVRIFCGTSCQIENPTVNVQYKAEELEGGRAGNALLNRLICPEITTDTEIFCCLTEQTVKFHDLEPEGLEHIYAPVYYDASYCGRFSCGNSVANHYSFMKRILTRKGSELAPTECSPNKYKSLTVLTVHPDDSTQLVVTVWDEAVALSCGCF